MSFSLHPQFFDILFISKLKVTQVFKDVLGLYDLNHISINRVINNEQLLTLSSTPAMEFNLFKSNFWHFDKTYNLEWVCHEKASNWQNLYEPEYFDELYYLKQLKPNFPTAYSVPIKTANEFYIYSLASHRKYETSELSNHLEVYTKIGQYCASLLSPLLEEFKL